MRAWMLFLAGCSGGQTLIDGQIPTDPGATPTPKPACVEGIYLQNTHAIDVADCATSEAIHSFAGAGGSVIELGLDGLTADAHVFVETVYGDPVDDGVVADGDSLPIELPWSGEFIARIVTEPGEVQVTRSCASGCDLPYTRYPVFFFHGMAGTDSFLSIIDYWFGIIDALEEDGIEVATDAVDPFQSSQFRAEQWADHLEDYLNDGRHRKVNVIGHSQGGLDARYVAAHLDPDHRIASVLTIGTPHHGVGMVESAEVLLDSGLTTAAVDAAFDALVPLWGLDEDQDIVAQLQGFHPDTAAEFNLNTPDRADVYYASWGGRSCQALDLLCQAGNNGEIITIALTATHFALELIDGENDGLVSVESARWGVDYGVISGDHLDEVGLLGGPITSRGFEPVPFYRDEVDRLRTLGF